MISDERAMLLIQGVLSGVEWSPDTLDTIADIVRLTGREIAESEPPFTCDYCFREESVCSADPCNGVRRDRGE